MEEIYRERDRILAETSNKKIEPLLKKIRELEAREKIIIENTINESKLIQNTFQISNPLNKKLFIQRSKLQNINDKIETLKLRDGRKLLEETSLKDEAVNTTVANQERLRTKTNPAEGEDLEIIPEDNSPKMNPENIAEVNDNITILKEQTDVIDPKILEQSPFLKDYISAVNKEIDIIEKITTREEDLNKSVKAGLSCLVKKG